MTDSEIFTQAVQLSGEQRQDFLLEACGDDHELALAIHGQAPSRLRTLTAYVPAFLAMDSETADCFEIRRELLSNLDERLSEKYSGVYLLLDWVALRMLKADESVRQLQTVATDRGRWHGFGLYGGTTAARAARRGVESREGWVGQLDVDTRTDVYSLGVILYELLVGETPLASKELRSQGLEQLLRTIREQEPARHHVDTYDFRLGSTTLPDLRLRGSDTRNGQA